MFILDCIFFLDLLLSKSISYHKFDHHLIGFYIIWLLYENLPLKKRNLQSKNIKSNIILYRCTQTSLKLLKFMSMPVQTSMMVTVNIIKQNDEHLTSPHNK